MKLFDYTGIIHFHSEYSWDGRIPIGDIIKAARENGIDFLMLTDHSCLEARKRGVEGWNEDVLLVVGQEISPRFNHYIAFGIDEAIAVDEEATVPPQEYIDQVKRGDGIGFIAHPDHEGTELFHVKQFPWMDWSVSGYTGVGVWDFMTDWQSSLTNYPKALLSFAFPAHFLRGPRQVTLDRWDRLNQTSKVVGIGELDNHDTPKKICGLNISVFKFKKAFRFIRTHLLLDKPFEKDNVKDINAIINALRGGRAYVALEHFRKSRGFVLYIFDNNATAMMGDEFVLKENALLHVETPAHCKIRVIRDGETLREDIATRLEFTITEKGVYRVEAYIRILYKYRPWIFSNPIYVI
ncbi:MAG: PHP domain-containing protein [Deltaproteobacteria bacterium]|nr:PHP domain-containing protein [Deltaproteobacteria bacterium]